jgi:ABC-2 type transport system ATP-binding protein
MQTHEDAPRGGAAQRRSQWVEPAKGRPAVTVRDLTKQFGATRAVDRVSFTVTTGKVTGFLGPNGAGKTTTIRAILGLARPDSGDALVFGRPYSELDNPLSRVGALIDGSSFHPLRTASAHLTAVAAAANVPKSRVDEVLQEVELAHVAHRRARELSLGMRQRLGLATALLGDPDVLILDEPANGLDPAGIRWLRAFLRSFAASGRTALVSSHVLAEVAQMADDVVVINKGRLVTHTTVRQLTAPTSVIVRSPEPQRLLNAVVAAGGAAEMGDGGVVEVTDMSAQRIGEIAARDRFVLHELTPRTHSLEEVFLQLTDSKGEARDVVG